MEIASDKAAGQRYSRGTFTRSLRENPSRIPTAETKSSALAAAGTAFEDQLREAVILATLVRHPDLSTALTADLERLRPVAPEHDAVRAALLQTGGANSDGISFDLRGRRP